MNCIIIDDEEMARAIITEMVSRHPDLKLIQEFPNAIQAIKFLNNFEVDLIFLDIHMPDFTGFDFIQSLKNPPRIILVTSDKGVFFKSNVFLASTLVAISDFFSFLESKR